MKNHHYGNVAVAFATAVIFFMIAVVISGCNVTQPPISTELPPIMGDAAVLLRVSGDETDISDMVSGGVHLKEGNVTWWMSGEIPSGEGYVGKVILVPFEEVQEEIRAGGLRGISEVIVGPGRFTNEVDMDLPMIAEWDIAFLGDPGVETYVLEFYVDLGGEFGYRDRYRLLEKAGMEPVRLHYNFTAYGVIWTP